MLSGVGTPGTTASMLDAVMKEVNIYPNKFDIGHCVDDID